MIDIQKHKRTFTIIFYFIFFMFLVPFVISVILEILSQMDLIKLSMGTKVLWNNFFAALVSLFVYILIFKKELIQQFKSINFKKILKYTLLHQVFYFAFVLTYNFLMSHLFQIEASENQQQVELIFNLFPVLMGLNIVLFAPFNEEIVFRFAMINAKTKQSKINTLLFSSLIFGLIHVIFSLVEGHWFDLIYLPMYASMGFFFGLTYLKTENIFGSIFHHAFHNSIAVLMLLLLK